MEINETLDELEHRLPWHKPELQQLVISFDTKFEAGSGVDGGFIEPAVPA